MSSDRFCYEGYEVDGDRQRVVCHYSLGARRFTEEIAFSPGDPEQGEAWAAAWRSPALHAAARILFLLAGVSYYKTAAPPVIDLGTTATSEEERAFLRAFYVEGLAELAYRSGLDLSGLQVVGPDAAFREPAEATLRAGRPLVPFGAGIDSLVTVSRVARRHPGTSLFVVSPPGDRFAAIEDAAAATGLPVVRAERRIDPSVLRSEEPGFLNGHVPVTGILSAVALVAAVAGGHDAIVMSNERSASAPTLWDGGRPINHQWSKGAAFESAFRRLLVGSLEPASAPAYFSYLRSRSELWVAREFARLDRYHRVFRSCNRAFASDPARRLDRWCGTCDKCCFVDLVLSPFLPARELAAVFDGREPLGNPKLAPKFRALVATGEEPRPFECVGDEEESRAAAVLAAAREDRARTAQLQALAEEVRAAAPQWSDPASRDAAVRRLLAADGPDFVPPQYRDKAGPAIGASASAAGAGGPAIGASASAAGAGGPAIRARGPGSPNRPSLGSPNRPSLGSPNRPSLGSPNRPSLGWSDLEDARVGLFGLRMEGAANLRRLRRMGVVPVVVDDHPAAPVFGGLRVLSGGEGLDALAACEVVVKSPGISRRSPAVKALVDAGVPVAGGLGLWLQDADRARVACVTGTKGKSTTAALAGHLLGGLGLRCLVAGNIGLPPWDPGAGEDWDFWIVETSSFQATDVASSPRVVAVTSLAPDHLDWHGSEEAYYQDKLSLCSQPGAALTVADASSDALRAHAHLLGPEVWWVAEGDPELDGPWVGALALPGRHYRRDALVARACLVGLGVDDASDDALVASAAEGFEPLEHRFRSIGAVSGVEFVDDSLSTNVLPTIAALDALGDRPVALLVGGHDRGLDYGPLAAALRSRRHETLVATLPTAGARIGKAVREAKGGSAATASLEVADFDDLSGAVAAAFSWARAHGGTCGGRGVVLLSPAAPSFGQFRDYRDRAEAFAAAMRACEPLEPRRRKAALTAGR